MVTKNPDAWPLKDTINKDSEHNHGFENTAGVRGQEFIEPYGLDRSAVAGTAQDERHTERGMGGGPTNVSHSLRGTSANQTGRSRG